MYRVAVDDFSQLRTRKWARRPTRASILPTSRLIRDKDEIDLAIDPPPDLAIEVDNLTILWVSFQSTPH